jgi:hypothetical protein
MMATRSESTLILHLASAALVAGFLGCSGSAPPRTPIPPAGTGGDSGTGGAVTPPSSTGGTVGGGTGGSAATGGSGAVDAGAPPAGDGGATGSDGAAPATSDGGYVPPPSGPMDFGKVGELKLVPLAYTPEPVPPIVAMDCPDDPAAGMTEYQDSFVVQRPYDLAGADRFKYEGGIYTEWVMGNDKAHAPGNGTAPRTEVRYSDFKTGEHLWEGDFMLEAPAEDVCIFQVKGALGPIGVYLRVNGGAMHQLRGGDGGNFLTDLYGKWYHLSVYWNVANGTGKVYINHCLKSTIHGTTGSIWYFKHGTYTCQSTVCRDHFKNIHLYQRGSTDPVNVMSPIK